MMPLPLRRIVLLFISLVVVCSPSLLAQMSDLYGIVTDSLTKQRIPFTNISVVGTQRGAAANNLGFYFIPKLPPGTYEVAASSIGYIRGVKSVVIREGKSVELNFELAPVPIQNEEVLVTAPRKRLEIETKTTSVHVLDRQDLKLVPVAGQQDLLQSLKILPGIVSTSDVSSRFYIRGGAGDQNLFMFDGIRIYYPFHALGIYSTGILGILHGHLRTLRIHQMACSIEAAFVRSGASIWRYSELQAHRCFRVLGNWLKVRRNLTGGLDFSSPTL